MADKMNFTTVTDNHTSTRQEKYALFRAIRDDPEESVINFMKTNPWTLSCMFWFETYIYKEGHIIEKVIQCSCAKNLELCMKPNVCKQEMLKRLELSIACGMCPHVIFHKKGLNVTYDQDIAACDVLDKFNFADLSNRSTRHSCIYHGGIYWIQLAILFGKIKLLNEILLFCIECKIKPIDMLSINYQISPIVLAVLHQESEIVESIASTYTELVRYNNHCSRSTPRKDYHELAIYYNVFRLALQKNQFKDFKILFQFYKGKYNLDCEALWKIWIDKMRESNIAGDENALHCLLSITHILNVNQYQYLFHYINTSGSYWIYKMIFEKIDFFTRFIKNGKPKADPRILDEMMIKAIFTGDCSVVKLFIDNGFNKNAMFHECSALAWAEALNYVEIVNVLSEVNAATTQHPYGYSMVFLAIDYKKARECLIHFNPLPIVHRLCEKGHSLENPIDPLLTAWENGQNHVVKYLLFRGADPVSILKYRYLIRCSKAEFSRFIHHLIMANRTISVYEWLKVYNMAILTFNENRLDIIDEVSDPGINLSVEKYVINNIQNPSDTLLADITEWCSKPRGLTVLCRRALRKHYKGFLYERFLRCVRYKVPKSTYRFLELNDIFSIISSCTSYSKEKLDKETDEVDEYFQ